MAGVARVGISGWRYRSWRGDFYPPGLVQRRELEYAADRLDTVEINGSFYSLQRPSSYVRWASETPPGFVFAVKGARYIRHMLRLRNADAALANFFGSGVLALGGKLGPILWQLPERVQFDEVTLRGFLARLPGTATEAAVLARQHDEKLKHEPFTKVIDDAPLRYALEVRHDSFAGAESLALLHEHGVALVVADTAGRWPLVRERTAQFDYIRLHGDTELYASGYSDESLDRWAAEVAASMAEGRDVYVYFDNDARGHAPHDAVRLRERVAARGR